ncbi:MAG: type II secretion system F family protein [Clostridia bacterium]|nr:type II secretion system F family protein [Clostridia bacterium]
MKKFKYTAMNLDRKKFSGTFLAEDEKDLARKLSEQGLYLVKASPVTSQTASTFFSTTGKVTANELATFCRQFAIMINTGIPIIEALDILRTQSYSSLLKKTLEFIYEDVKGGELLSQSMEKHKKIFPVVFSSLIGLGELSGALDKILVTLADYFETDARIKSKTKSAMLYPIILIIMALGIVTLLVLFIIPTFIDAFSVLEVDMPAFTMALFNFSEFLKEYWKEIILVIAVIIGGLILFGRTKRGKYVYDAIKYRAPILGKITQALVTARFSRALGILLDGGLDVVDALETVQIVLGNTYVEKRFQQAIEDVRQGGNLAESLDKYRIFPALIIQMIAVGEKTGSIAEVLLRSCSFFDTQAEAAIGSITTIIQPLILVIIGGSVGMLFYAVYSPLLQVMNGLGV